MRRSDFFCAVLLILQGVAIVRARTVSSRYFCWAPFDIQTEYELTVALPNRQVLTGPAAGLRYRLPDYGQDNRSPQHIIDTVQQYEQTYGRNDHAQVLMQYTVNGTRRGQWRWPVH